MQNDVERVGDLNVNWLIIDGNGQVGVAGLDFLPSYIMKIWSNIRFLDSQLKVVVFDSKERSIKFEKALCLKHGLTYPDKLVIEKSRYSIFYVEKNPYYLLLNNESMNENTAIFLTALSLKIMQKIKSNRDILSKEEILINSVGKVFLDYNRRMGIPFVSADEGIRTLIRNLISNVQQDYFEGSALKELLEDRIYSNDIGEYIKYKIEMTLAVMDYEARFLILEVFQTLEKMLHISVLFASISSNASLAQFLRNSFNKEYDNFKKKYSELPDLVRAADYIFSGQSKIVFSTYDKYAEAISRVIQQSFSEIEPRYVALAEGVDLLRLSEYYLEGLEKGQFVLAPNIGTIHGYVKLLKKIFEKEGTYPEVRIIAGYALENSLLSWLMIDHTISLFQEYAICTKQLAELIEKSLPEIHKKNGSIGGLQGSPITYEDAALKLLFASKIAKSFGDAKTEKELTHIVERMTSRYNLDAIRVILWWGKFVDTQNFSYLNKIHENLRELDLEKLSRSNYLIGPIDLLIQSILYQEQIDQNIERAEKTLLESTAEGAALNVYAKASLRTTEGFYHILEMFKGLLKWQEESENIRKAYVSALALNDTLVPTDPLLIMSTKTQIVYKLLNNDLEASSNLCKKLSRYDDPEAHIKQFLDIAKAWIDICSKGEERRYIYQHEFQYKGKDIWIQISLNFIYQSMEDDLYRNIAGAKAVVFVEGVTDLLVFKTFKDKIRPDERIHFLDTEGFTNYKYYAESKVIKELKIPIYLIFDGDTRQEKKRKAIKDLNRLSIQTSHIYTLKQNSIENYLLKPQSIRRAYSKKVLSEENIREFLAKTKNRKNKKQVLQSLFDQFKLGSYNKNAAEQIAFKTKVNEIDPEIAQLLKRIMKLENV